MRLGSQTRWIALLAATTAALAACAGGDPGGGAESPAASPANEAAQPSGPQELVVAYGDDEFVDNEANQKSFAAYPLNANVCETPLQLTEDFQVDPEIATDWEYVGDNTFRFTVREGVSYHNGEPVTPESFDYSMDYVAQDPPLGVAQLSFLTPESSEVADDGTVEITPDQPNLRLIEQINHPEFIIVAPGNDPLADLKAAGGRLTADQGGPICTGPFRFVEYVANEHIIVERNDDYWREPTELDRITFRFIPDESTRVLALQSGEVDVIADVDRSLVSSLEGQAGLKVVPAPPGQVIVGYVAQRDHQGNPRITADPAVRRAMALAIDRDAYVEGVLDGNANRVDTVSPPSVLGEHADLVEGVPHDPEEAASVLEEAGWTEGGDGVRTKDGQRLHVTIIFDPVRITLPTAEYVQSQLAAVGFEAEVLQLESAAYRERLNDTGDYDLDISAPNQNNANPAFLLGLRWYSKSRIPNAAVISPGPDTEFDALIDQIQQTSDPDELRRLAAEAMHQLVDVEVGAIPLAGTYRIWAMREEVQGFEPHPSGINQRWDTVFLSE